VSGCSRTDCSTTFYTIINFHLYFSRVWTAFILARDSIPYNAIAPVRLSVRPSVTRMNQSKTV